MARFQGAALVASPSYPNSIAWSEENLIAVASGHIVTILNPAMPFGPRGLVRTASIDPYPIGRVQSEDLLRSCLLSTALSHDRRQCVRSIAWSRLGMAPNYGCLLAVCTVEGKVKIYGPPYCDFSSEWIEVVDISDRLYDYLARTNFGELKDTSRVFGKEQQTLQGCLGYQPDSCHKDPPVPTNMSKKRRVNVTVFSNKESKRFGYKSGTETEENLNDGFSADSMKEKNRTPEVVETKSDTLKQNKPGNSLLPLITPEQYASRSAILSSLVVSWSPVLWISSKICQNSQNYLSKGFSVLAVGGQSGKISFWRIHAPECYTIEHNKASTTAVLVGLLEAHSSWITTISLTLTGSKSNPQVLVASGSSDGSVKIWLGDGAQVLKTSEATESPFVLLKEVVPINSIPTTIVSLPTLVQPLHKILLAIGKGSGSFEVWICDIPNCKYDNAGLYDAHDSAVTGLTWAFDGRCLYTCSQDNYVRGWTFRGNSLCEVSITSNIPGLRSSTDLPDAYLSCLGVSASMSNLVIAMVRSLDVEQLDRMYEGRLQKAVVDFFWIGGQQLDMVYPTSFDSGHEAALGFPANELVCWDSNILCSLTKYEDLDNSLVIWDVIAVLLAFKTSIQKYVDHILHKWLAIRYLRSHMDVSIHEVLAKTAESCSEIGSRQLHLLNVICRRVVLSELKAEEINSKENFEGLGGAEGNLHTLWMKLLFSSERELRERLVGLTLSYSLSHMPDSTKSRCWYPVGVAQMARWVELNHHGLVRDQLKFMASETRNHEQRRPLRQSEVKEQCTYCSALVPFTSPEADFCLPSERVNGVLENHKLARCAVSMQVCPAADPAWFCKCCHRWVSQLAPEAFFKLPRYPSEFKSLTKHPFVKEVLKPLCPFCGILLQRLQPDFLLSVTPV